MPRAPKRPCPHPGCSALTDGGPCEQHRKQRRRTSDRWRGSAASRGYDRDWKRLRDAHLREEPLCRMCQAEGRTEPATQVDHIVPFDGVDDPLRLDPDNLQSLCTPHHSAKTAREDGGFGNRKGPPLPIGCDADGLPTDPRHPWNRGRKG